MTKASIYFHLRTEKPNKKTGKIPIYLRILINRSKAESRLSCDVDEAQSKHWNPRIMRFEDTTIPANKVINKIQQGFDDLVYRHALDLHSVTAGELRDQLLGTRKTGETLLNHLVKHYKESILCNDSITEGTKRNYKKALDHMESYLSYTKKRDLLLINTDHAIGSGFHDYLLSTIEQCEKKGIRHSTAAGYVKKIKAILQRAYENGKLERNPFIGVKLKSQSRYREKLNSNEVKSIFELDLGGYHSLDKARKIFLFSVFTGLANQDAMDLKWNDIQTWSNNEFYFHLMRNKTGVETKQFLVSYALDIIQNFRKEGIRELVLPSVSNQALNMRLKVLAEKAGISKPMTSHIARHTFRQMLAEAGIKDMGSIKTMMGHSRQSDIDAVYHTVTEKQLLEAKQQYQLFLDNLFKNEF